MGNAEAPVVQQSQSFKNAMQIAWGTLGLFLSIVLAYGLLIWAYFEHSFDGAYASILASILVYLSFTVVHEAGHGNISLGQKWCQPLESVMGWVASIPFVIVPFRLFSRLHDLHHAHVNHPEKDPDHWAKSLHPLGIVLRAATMSANYYYKAFICYKQDPGVQSAKWSSLLYLAAWAVAIAAGIYFGYGKALLNLVFIPYLVSGIVLVILFDWLPHAPHNREEKFHSTRIFLFPGAQWLTLGQNFHLIHHLYPRVPWYQYAKMFQQKRKLLESRGVAIEQAFSFAEKGLLRSPSMWQTNQEAPFKAVAEDMAKKASTEHYKVIVKLNPSKHTELNVPSEHTILEAALAQGLRMRHACKEGHCGSCKVKIEQGSVEHGSNIEALLPQEQANGLALACQCKAKSDLVINCRIMAS